MRISDWSSDVCSSDLCPIPLLKGSLVRFGQDSLGVLLSPEEIFNIGIVVEVNLIRSLRSLISSGRREPKGSYGDNRDRKSVVSGKSVSVRVDLGGRSIIKKKKKKQIHGRTETT